MPPSRHIHPEHLHPYVGTNAARIRSFLDLFRQELVSFEAVLTPVADQEKLAQVRAAYHSILPSLKILRLESLIDLIEQYKTDQTNSAGDSGIYERIITIIGEINNELTVSTS